MKPTLLIIAATGPCAFFTLVHALRSSHSVSALVRTPSKLKAMLALQNLTETHLSHLKIHTGDAKDTNAITRALFINGAPADIVISGVGGTLTTQLSLFRPFVLTDPTICEDSTKALLSALDQEQARPVVVAISSTGVSSIRDTPMWGVPLYRFILGSPREDKRKMEDLWKHEMDVARNSRSVVVVRPSLLVDGESKGLEYVREGTHEMPAIGVKITRADVGRWIFENVVQKQHVSSGFVNLTY